MYLHGHVFMKGRMSSLSSSTECLLSKTRFAPQLLMNLQSFSGILALHSIRFSVSRTQNRLFELLCLVWVFFGTWSSENLKLFCMDFLMYLLVSAKMILSICSQVSVEYGQWKYVPDLKDDSTNVGSTYWWVSLQIHLGCCAVLKKTLYACNYWCDLASINDKSGVFVELLEGYNLSLLLFIVLEVLWNALWRQYSIAEELTP